MTRRSSEDWGRFGGLRSTVEAVDGDCLKRVGVATYFGVYALIALGGWQALVGATQRLPRSVRPPAPGPLHVLFGLPRSVAWSIVSLSVTVVTLGALATVHVARARDEDPPSLGDIGSRTWRDRCPSLADIPRRHPELTGLVRAGSTRPSGSTIEVLDESLVAPAAPLSLPHATSRHPSIVAENHVVAEGYGTHVAASDDSGVTDGGVSMPGADSPRPAHDEDRNGSGGSDRCGDPDPAATWPDDWRGGDAL